MIQPSANPGVGRSFSTGKPDAESALMGGVRRKNVREITTIANIRVSFMVYAPWVMRAAFAPGTFFRQY